MTSLPPSPPITPSQIDFDPEPPSWPKVIGIISIVWAALGLTCMGCMTVGIVMQDFSSQMMANAKGPNGESIPPMPDVMKSGALEWAQMTVGFILAAVLLVAGIQLVRRNPIARLLHLAYSASSIVVTLAGLYPGLMKQRKIAEWAAQNPDNFWATAQQQNAAFAQIAIAIAVVVGMAYPIFLLVWFGGMKRNSQAIAEGLQRDHV